jgi:hypothetical protein
MIKIKPNKMKKKKVVKKIKNGRKAKKIIK